ncbi:MAG: glutamate--cysteine ligase [Candidatus Sedimenticola sp. 6PFRAG7]
MQQPQDRFHLYQSVEKRLAQIAAEGHAGLLGGGAIGLEKESLRVSPEGGIAQTPHPHVLGAALTHPYITTDYSEALTEFITPPFEDVADALDFLRDTQKFVYQSLDDEVFWSTSMPCVLAGGANIPIARYGSSNAGTMKTVYRRGLGHRYGRVMQVIAGVHFNFSLDPEIWPVLHELDGTHCELRHYVDAAYFGLTRNLQRYGWLIPYLFGASPAVCKSFLSGKPTQLQEFDRSTYYEPFATSLRMGDIGYTNSKEKGVGIKACYNSLDAYVDSLTHAIETSSPVWEKIGVKVNGRYEQLNTNILQIENEYYSTVRPKQLLEGMEKPTHALKHRGVRYVELRSLDVNAFHPLGVSDEQLRFLKVFMLFCMLQESPPINLQEQREIDQNIGGAAHRGRDPGLFLSRQGREIRLRDWARELLDAMSGISEMLDAAGEGDVYGSALELQRAAVEDPALTPSARMLAEMESQDEGFFHFARRMSLQHRDFFEGIELSAQRSGEFEQEASASHERQAEIEAADDVSFDVFLDDYLKQ